MRYLHTMVRIADVDASLHFYCDLLGLELAKTIVRKAGSQTTFSARQATGTAMRQQDRRRLS